MVEGHELAETITDPGACTAWHDDNTPPPTQPCNELGDKCQNGPTGAVLYNPVSMNGQSYFVQPLWSNLINDCSYGTTYDSVQTAFQANTGNLWIVPGLGGTTLGITPRTSPSLAHLTLGGYEAAFNADGGGGLWNTGFGNGSDTYTWNAGLDPHASPGICPLQASGGYEDVFNSNVNTLWSAQGVPLALIHTPTSLQSSAGPLTIAAGTSPSDTCVTSGGWDTAWHVSDDSLWRGGSVRAPLVVSVEHRSVFIRGRVLRSLSSPRQTRVC